MAESIVEKDRYEVWTADLESLYAEKLNPAVLHEKRSLLWAASALLLTVQDWKTAAWIVDTKTNKIVPPIGLAKKGDFVTTGNLTFTIDEGNNVEVTFTRQGIYTGHQQHIHWVDQAGNDMSGYYDEILGESSRVYWSRAQYFVVPDDNILGTTNNFVKAWREDNL